MRALWIVFLLGLVGKVAGQQPGELDLSFAVDGKLILYGFGPAVDVRSLPEGGIRVVSSFTENGLAIPCVIGLLDDGSIDQSYAVDGVYRIHDPVSASHSILYADDDLCFAYWKNDSVLFVSKHDGGGMIDEAYGIEGIASLQPGASFGLSKVRWSGKTGQEEGVS